MTEVVLATNTVFYALTALTALTARTAFTSTDSYYLFLPLTTTALCRFKLRFTACHVRAVFFWVFPMRLAAITFEPFTSQQA